MSIEVILFGIVILAGFYLAWNIGANDVANAMGTSVGSGALTLKQAVIVAAVLEFSGAFFFGSHVSDTVQNGIVDSSLFANNPLLLVYGMLASLLAAGVWLQIASYFGWPVSTTHSIVGAIVGFGAVVGGWEAIHWENVSFIVSSWILSPLMGGGLSYLIFTILRKKILYTANPVKAAQSLTPSIVFIVITTLALIMMFNGLENLDLHLSFFKSFVISLIIGAVGSLISWFLVRRIKGAFEHKAVAFFNPEVARSLEKAKKHIERVKASCKGEMEFQAEVILESVDSLSHALKRTEDFEASKSEYAAVEKIFGYLQIISACMMAFAHGANDVANAIGPLSACIIVLTTHAIPATASVPVWALALGGFGIVVGLATWGWRVMETIGKKITELTPTRGFAAEFGAAVTVVIASRLGLPISTTHTLVGSVVGVGLARGIEALNLSMTRDIIVSWIVTVPAGAAIAVVFFYAIQSIFG